MQFRDKKQQRRCGLYRTTRPIEGAIAAGVLVHFHNHGNPGPGVYLPKLWKNNRAVFRRQGTTVPEPGYAATLEPLLPEGFYRVAEGFFCCDSECKHFEQDRLVQLGYNANAEAILFLPKHVDGVLALPSKGTRVDRWKLESLAPLKVPDSDVSDATGLN